MTAAIDHTHAPGLRSWVSSANGHADFPIQNLPLGVFSPPSGGARMGVAIGDMVLDVAASRDALHAGGSALEACAGTTLNALLALGAGPRNMLRHAVSALLAQGAIPRPDLLYAASSCVMHLPAQIGDYTDFYAGLHHATNVGRLFRPDAPLLPNYKHMPIGYHGRASSVQPSGVPVRRPNGQRLRQGDVAPSFGPCERLDYELELGIWVGPGNALGTAVPIGQASSHIAGFCLLNDWSARDVQAWEYRPLGPFLAKSFQTTISPWIITPEALAPFRVAQPPRPAGDPQPLPYLLDAADQQVGALGMALEVLLLTPSARQPHRLSAGNADLYWTPAQMLAHQASNGCNLRPGDLLGSGTISSPTPVGLGSLLEITQGGRRPVALADGETRTFLEDGDEIILRGRAHAEGRVSIGFGECRGVVQG